MTERPFKIIGIQQIAVGGRRCGTIGRLRGGDRDGCFAVNLLPSESRTAPLPVDQLEQAGVRMGERRPPEEVAAAERQMRGAELENRQK